MLLVPLAAAVALQTGQPHGQHGAAAILRKMTAVNASVKTYTVRIHFDAKVHSFLSLPLVLNATYYYKQPDKMQIVFDSVPSLAKQFQNFYASTGTPATWPKTYIVTLEPPQPGEPSDNGNVTLRLTPRNGGSLDHADITVDTSTYGIVIQQWIYKDGSSINVAQFNETSGTYVLPSHQEADFSFPKYKAHVAADYDSYDINVPIPDSVFKEPQ